MRNRVRAATGEVRDPSHRCCPGIAMNLRTAFQKALAQLTTAGVPSSGLAAELLLMHTLERDRTYLHSHPECELSREEERRFFSLVSERAAGTPTQYLTGHQEFWGLDLLVEPGVFIPRPETEHVVETVLEWLASQRWKSSVAGRPLRLADVGTGSGCLAIALAHELPEAEIFSTDTSLQALALARRNAERLGVARRVRFLACNLLDGLMASATKPLLDAVVSNPPYVGREEAALLPREVREHEPAQALFSGENGLELYAPLIEQAGARLRPGGLLALELGYGASEKAIALVREGWKSLRVRPDLAGIPRVLSAERL
ncbi:MAG TPA: peptide chain release factor N(5)-glutamine methyltransferase [Candidatus Acidoferrales bacterium]